MELIDGIFKNKEALPTVALSWQWLFLIVGCPARLTEGNVLVSRPFSASHAHSENICSKVGSQAFTRSWIPSKFPVGKEFQTQHNYWNKKKKRPA